jgi:N,N'-diacetyllegionaminate synthase
MTPALRVGRHAIDGPEPPLFLPDIDVYFHGDVERGLLLLESLKAAGCSVVKGALIHDLDICYRGSVLATFFDPARGMVQEPYREVLRRHLLPLASAARLYARARELDLDVVLTVYDFQGADAAVDFGACALKVASSNVTHAPLIRYVAGKGLPVFLDTGRSTLEEISRAVTWAREAGASQIVVQHSPEGPPAPLERQHLRMLGTLRSMFACPVGLSDHHAGHEMILAAVALGASVVEKGVCDDAAGGDIDLAHAARVGEVAGILAGIGKVWRAVREPVRDLPPGRPRPADRMALAARTDLGPGSRVGLETTTFVLAAPAEAIPVERWDLVSGWTIRRPVKAGEALTWGALEPPGEA